MLEVGLLSVGKTVRVLGQDGLVAVVDFGLTLRGEFCSLARGLRWSAGGPPVCPQSAPGGSRVTGHRNRAERSSSCELAPCQRFLNWFHPWSPLDALWSGQNKRRSAASREQLAPGRPL